MTLNIDERTRVPLFAAIAIVPVLAVCALWIGTVSERVTAAEQRTDRIVDKIVRMEAKEDQMLEKLSAVRESLARIEERLRISSK